MDQKQHLLSEDDDACSDEAKDHLQDAFDKHRYHSCRKSWLRYYLLNLHLWAYIYILILHLVLAVTLIILTKNSGLSAFQKHIHVGSYCRLSDNKKSSLIMAQPLH